jgi:hypothetical protein
VDRARRIARVVARQVPGLSEPKSAVGDRARRANSVQTRDLRGAFRERRTVACRSFCPRSPSKIAVLGRPELYLPSVTAVSRLGDRLRRFSLFTFEQSAV